MKLLNNKVALITGASSGIGRAAAKLFAAHGAKVVVGARREDRLRQLVDEVRATGGEIHALAGDVKSQGYNSELVELAIAAFGRLDVALNNAGMLGTTCETTALDLEQWHDVVETNLTSAFLAAKHQIPQMQDRGGSIIFTASFVGHTVGMPQHAAYAASKAGVIGLTKALSSEYGASGVRVNALLPGGTDTDMASEFGDSPEERAFVRGLHALKRLASPEEIAQSALYLASDMSSFTTGSAMLVDGGVSICRT